MLIARQTILMVVVAVAATACFEDNQDPTVLRLAEPSGGPRIVFDLDERPFPEIPFPNDLATRVDPTSPTGLRVNVSEIGANAEETRVRLKINEQAGFGVLSPMWVRFESPLNVRKIAERHQEPVPNFADDVIYLVNIDRDSPNFGRFELLDLGRGNYPIIAPRSDRYFPNDPRSQGNNLLFETVREVDLNDNGVLDPIEDTDDDGVWDQPNVYDPDVDPTTPGNLIEFYEKETNTLYIRSVMPLDSGTTYAMVITDEMTSPDGLPVDSPFAGINHARQTDALQPLRQILPQAFPERFDVDLSRVRFAWSFTTGVPEDHMLSIRAGLYGNGPLAWLHDEYPAELEMIHNQKKPGADNPLTFDVSSIAQILVPILSQEVGQGAAGQIQDQFDDIDYIVSGSFVSPYFLTDDDGHADTGVEGASTGGNPADDDETFRIDLPRGEAVVGQDEVTFICTVPKERPGRAAPFPTMIYSHAISSTRLENLLFGAAFAKFGIASCAIDAVGHGIAIPPEFTPLVKQVTMNLDIPNFGEVIDHDRARDLDNDGIRNSGGKYFTSDILHSRDNIRQTAIDQMQLIRILRTWDGERRFPDAPNPDSVYVQARPDLVAGYDQDGDGEPELAGDFNADGTVDFGGDVAYVSFGTSLGGIQTALLAAYEPTVIAAASNAGGGVLGDIAMRTTISNVRNGVILRMFGPLLLGNLNEEGDLDLRWLLASADDDVTVPFATISGIEEGDRVVLRNLVREQNPVVPEDDKEAVSYIRNGQLRIAIAADAVGTTARRALLGLDPTVDVVDDLIACAEEDSCGDEECEAGFTCQNDACYPIAACIADFDGSTVPDEFADEYPRHVIEDATDWGDPLVIEIYGADGELKETIDTFPNNTIFENILYPAGSPLAALTQGWGLKRQTPRMRKFLGVAQTLLEPADPAVAARHYMKRPFTFEYEDPRFRDGFTRFLMTGTIGDETVPIANSIAIARAAGYVGTRRYEGAYGTTQNRFLIDNWVYEGVAALDRFPDYPNTLFDPDDLDQGRFRARNAPDEPNPNPDGDPPLRATVEHADGSVSGLRLPYIRTDGEHTFNVPDPASAFDIATFMTHQVAWYLINSGRILTDDLCLVDPLLAECTFYDYESFEASPIER